MRKTTQKLKSLTCSGLNTHCLSSSSCSGGRQEVVYRHGVEEVQRERHPGHVLCVRTDRGVSDPPRARRPQQRWVPLRLPSPPFSSLSLPPPHSMLLTWIRTCSWNGLVVHRVDSSRDSKVKVLEEEVSAGWRQRLSFNWFIIFSLCFNFCTLTGFIIIIYIFLIKQQQNSWKTLFENIIFHFYFCNFFFFFYLHRSFFPA